MTNKEAIEALKNAQSEVEWEYPIDYAAAMNKAIEALHKQIPRKTYVPSIKCSLSVGTCMSCGKSFSSIQNYCSWCGQRQDWSE